MNHIKHILIFTLLGLLSLVSSAQNVKFGFQAGIGTYDMADLKDFNSFLFKSLPFKAKIVSDYPPFAYYKPSILFSFNKVEAGIQGTFLSTGSRISSKDYSGEYRYDTKVQGWVPGIMANIALIKLNKKSRIWLTTEGGATYSNLKMKENFTLGDETISDLSNHFKCMEYYVLPGLKFEYNLYPSVGLEFNPGYFVHIKNADFKSDTNDMLSFGPNWSGLRIGVSVFWIKPIKA